MSLSVSHSASQWDEERERERKREIEIARERERVSYRETTHLDTKYRFVGCQLLLTEICDNTSLKQKMTDKTLCDGQRSCDSRVGKGRDNDPPRMSETRILERHLIHAIFVAPWKTKLNDRCQPCHNGVSGTDGSHTDWRMDGMTEWGKSSVKKEILQIVNWTF